jgi:hypothetical protein
MLRLPLSGVLLVALALTGAACTDGTMRTAAQTTGYATSSSTAKSQTASGANAPLVSPGQSNAAAASTLKKQQESRYFPGSDALLAPFNPSDPQ